ncbi:F-box/LRR-repeat protein 25-like [Nicotiana sylvestris]|uniref:F-box/LRR-repeat protein 25-like n=1 Tax=Nicotiana sylvestris TaxID=4096 RepID=A0A1U7WNI6_NICSY|nr:PREDICTED: F-box/LRR-repeat protein 25-like [Nicotiana sylvestris]
MEEWCTTPPRKAKCRKLLEIILQKQFMERIEYQSYRCISFITSYATLAAQTSVFSKRWYYCWISRPHLEFNQLPDNIHMTLEKFVTLVDESLRFHVEKKLRLEEFIVTYHDPKLASNTDRWIDLVVKHNVKVLEIHVSGSESPYYSLPDVIYAGKELTKLGLSKCKFEFDIGTTNIRFCCLKDLLLHDVHISDGQLQRVIDRCPFIRNLTILACDGTRKLHVFGLIHLEILAVASCKLESVIVEAPNLRDYGYAGVRSIFFFLAKLKFWMLTILYKYSHSPVQASQTNNFMTYFLSSQIFQNCV